MNKFIGVFLTFVFLALSSIAPPAFARKEACTHRNNFCQDVDHRSSAQKDKLDSRFQLSSYSHILPYAQKLGWKGSVSENPFQCDADGNKVKAPGTHGCRDYKDKNGNTWRVPFAHHNATVTKIIRLSDGATVEFDSSGTVIADNTGIGNYPSIQQTQRERTEPNRAAEGQVPQIDPADIAKKALGTILKGF